MSFQKLQGKHILIDTCFLSAVFRYPREYFEDFFEMLLNEQKCTLCINEFINLEFIRIAKNKQELEKIKDFLADFALLPLTKDIWTISNDIYPLYNLCKIVRNSNQISIPDVLNISFIQKYQTNLYLLTLDHGDYPSEVAKRIVTGTIDVETNIITWAIYSFNQAGFDQIKRIYNK